VDYKEQQKAPVRVEYPAEKVGGRSVSLRHRTELLTAGPQSDSESYDELLNIGYIFKESDMLLVESTRLRS